MTHIFLLLAIFIGAIQGRICGSEFVASTVVGQTVTKNITLSNPGTTSLEVVSIELIRSANNSAFQINLSLNISLNETISIEASDSLQLRVSFSPKAIGPQSANLVITFASSFTANFTLRGLGLQGYEGVNEPSLQWILDAMGIPIETGDDDPRDNLLNSNAAIRGGAAPVGDELFNPSGLFTQLDASLPIEYHVLAVFGPPNTNPVSTWGWYPSGSPSNESIMFTVPNVPTWNSQTLYPVINGNNTFDPEGVAFGFYTHWPNFGPRRTRSQDYLNTWDSELHHMRTYRYRDVAGNPIQGGLVIVLEEYTQDKDFQDTIILLFNIQLENATVPEGNVTLSQKYGQSCYITSLDEIPSSTSSSESSSSASMVLTESESASASASVSDSASDLPTSEESSRDLTSQSRGTIELTRSSVNDATSSSNVQDQNNSAVRSCLSLAVIALSLFCL